MIAALDTDLPGHFHVYGVKGSGKTTLALRWARSRLPVLFMDGNGLCDPSWAKVQGLSLEDDSFELVQPASFEDALRLWSIYADAGVKAVVMDEPTRLPGWCQDAYFEHVQWMVQRGHQVMSLTGVRRNQSLMIDWGAATAVQISLSFPHREFDLQIGEGTFMSDHWSNFKVMQDHLQGTCNPTEGVGRFYSLGGR